MDVQHMPKQNYLAQALIVCKTFLALSVARDGFYKINLLIIKQIASLSFCVFFLCNLSQIAFRKKT